LTAEHTGRLELIWADSKYYNHRLSRWLEEAEAGYRIEVVSRPVGSVGFVMLPRRWVVEQSFAWLGRYRRNSRDYEWYTHTSESQIRISSIHRMLRLLWPDETGRAFPFEYRESRGRIPG
jgi:putative transposase